MSNNTHKLVVKFDIHYDGERMAVDRVEQLQSKILDFGIHTMLASQPGSQPASYSLSIYHDDSQTIQNLIYQLEACGVSITGRDKVLALGHSENWPADLTRIAIEGVREGVQFFRRHEDISELQLDHILSGFPLSYEQRDAVVNNILLTPNVLNKSAEVVLRRNM